MGKYKESLIIEMECDNKDSFLMPDYINKLLSSYGTMNNLKWKVSTLTQEDQLLIDRVKKIDKINESINDEQTFTLAELRTAMNNGYIASGRLNSVPYSDFVKEVNIVFDYTVDNILKMR